MITHVRNEPLIKPGSDVKSGRASPYVSHPLNNPLGTEVDSEHKGILLIKDLWTKSTNCILDTQIFSMNAASYDIKTP